MKSITISEANFSAFTINTALLRLPESYDSAIFLINNTFYFESFAIIRLIFEQLVYTINICDLSDEEFDKLSSSRRKSDLSSTNINKIKKLLPELKLGTFYRDLSSATHVGLEQAGKFIQYNEEFDKVMIVSRTPQMAIEAAFYLLRIIDIHQIIFEYSLRAYLPSYLKNRSINSKDFSVIKNRKTRIQALKFEEEFKLLHD